MRKILKSSNTYLAVMVISTFITSAYALYGNSKNIAHFLINMNIFLVPTCLILELVFDEKSTKISK